MKIGLAIASASNAYTYSDREYLYAISVWGYCFIYG